MLKNLINITSRQIILMYRLLASKRSKLAYMAVKRNAYRILVGKPEEKKPLGRFGCRLKENIEMNLKKQDGRVWNGLILITTWTSDGL